MSRFLFRDETISLAGERPDLTVLDWLRLSAAATGTKEGCGSGDCGACTVVTARPSPSPDGLPLVYESINACIAFVGSLHGRQLITVEDLAGASAAMSENALCVATGSGASRGAPAGAPVGTDATHTASESQLPLHPVQQAMVDEHGSQCGFCTPGFVMSLFALYHDRSVRAQADVSDARINHALGGNLCRCTGYRPIKRAARAALAGCTPDRFDDNAAATARRLMALADEAPGSVPDQQRCRGHRQVPFRDCFHIPGSLDELARLCRDRPAARLLAGGTDLALEVTQQLKALDELILMREVPELHELSVEHDRVWVGAAVPLARVHAGVSSQITGLADLLSRFGSEQVRNQGTLGGNLGTASPIGDLPPVLLALDATVILQSIDGTREVAIDDYFLDYRMTALQPGEFIRAVRIPRPADSARIAIYKVSKRFDDDISAVCAVFNLAFDGEVVRSARLAFGGMAAIPKRATTTEAALTGHPFDADAILRAGSTLQKDFAPIGDARASAGYRLQVATNLVERFRLETLHPSVATRIHQPVNRHVGAR